MTMMTMMTMMMMLMKNENDDDDEDDDVDHEDADDDDDGDDDDVIYMMIRRVPKRCAFQSNAFKRVPRGRVPKRGLHPQLPFVKEFVHIFSRRMDNTSKTLQTEEPHGPSRHHQCEEHLVTAILLIDETTTVEKAVCTVRPALSIFFPRRHIQTTRGLTKGKKRNLGLRRTTICTANCGQWFPNKSQVASISH